ncbi:hypothetical protein M513_01994 [Trichuris suis]|uniref:Uncharacterized protein n=1 Tax=Trichuris suis TaxID=68888 RepID=A0A085MIR3_9BILA|nr:hypothetical protein M513_01994 [Trichuris suis]
MLANVFHYGRLNKPAEFSIHSSGTRKNSGQPANDAIDQLIDNIASSRKTSAQATTRRKNQLHPQLNEPKLLRRKQRYRVHYHVTVGKQSLII